MCLAFPGRIVQIKGQVATVDYGSEKRSAQLLESSYAVGDYVIVQGKVVVTKVPKEQAERFLELLP